MLQNWVVSLNRWKIKALKRISTLFSLVESSTFTDTNEVISVNPSTTTNECKYLLITDQASEKSGQMRRFCLHKWFHDYKFLARLESSDGLFCLACTLFPMAAHQRSKAKSLISQPYRNWKDAQSDLSHHAVLKYHKDLMEVLKSFVSCF